MGNQCCRDDHINRDILNKVEAEILVPITNKQYYIHEWPQDEVVQNNINELKSQQEFKDLFENHKMMKHKYYDKYYVGNWNHEGYPEGKGVLLVPDTFLYSGDFKKTPEGRGIVELFRQKIKYEGQFRDGKAEGEGKITSNDGRYTFTGTMAESNPKSGKIVLHNAHDENKSYIITIDNFPQGKSQIEYADGRKYYGHINKKSLAPHGEGSAVFPDKSRFDGFWEEGQMHGNGNFYWNDGSSYRGDYQHGRKHGMGRFLFPSGKYYEGEWVHGKQSGKGTLFQKTHEVIQKGLWKDGVFLRESE